MRSVAGCGSSFFSGAMAMRVRPSFDVSIFVYFLFETMRA